MIHVLLVPSIVCAEVAQLPASTPLSIELSKHVSMKVGEPLEGRLLYPIYAQNRLVVPAGSVLQGTVVQLEPDRSHRIHARFRGDFTPFHIPVVRFDRLVLPDGSTQTVESDSSKDGVPILRLSPPPGKQKGGFVAQQFAAQKQRLKELGAQFTAPGRGDRLVQFLYTQAPYHPERIEAGTAWTVTLDEPLTVHFDEHATDTATDTAAVSSEQAQEWRLRAYLQTTISSARQKAGDTFEALVTEPVFNADHSLAVPQGALMVGEITQTKAARSFGRQGKLRFRFRELKLPNGFVQPVRGTLAGIDANKASNLELDSEGGVRQRSQNRVIVPMVLSLLASRAFDDDGSQIGHNALASNGFGIVGRLVGILANSRNVAAGIGIYGAALSFYDLWLAHGHDVVFTKNTRVEVTTTPGRTPMAAPPSQ